MTLSASGAQVATNSATGAVPRYLKDRENVRGHRIAITDLDPELAAEQLLEHVGPEFCGRLVGELALLLERLRQRRA